MFRPNALCVTFPMCCGYKFLRWKLLCFLPIPLVPLILIVLSLLMLIGSNESRLKKAGWTGNTVFFPFRRSLKAVETRQELKQEVFSLRKRLAETTLENLSLQNELKQNRKKLETIASLTQKLEGIKKGLMELKDEMTGDN